MFECVQSQIKMKENAYKTGKGPDGLTWADPEEAVWPRTHTALLHFPSTKIIIGRTVTTEQKWGKKSRFTMICDFLVQN